MGARATEMVTFLGIIGAVTIWPEKIGVLYAVFTHLSICALCRINTEPDRTDDEVVDGVRGPGSVQFR